MRVRRDHAHRHRGDDDDERRKKKSFAGEIATSEDPVTGETRADLFDGSNCETTHMHAEEKRRRRQSFE